MMPPTEEKAISPASPGIIQWPVAASALVVMALLAFNNEPRLALLLLIGSALGVTLQHASFGFTSAYRRFLLRRDTRALYAQLLMLVVATLLFAPVLSAGSVFGHGVAGAIAPAGLPVAAGAFLFGIGMQLGDGCGSGTLYKVGAGAPRMLVTLIAFCAGSFWASLHMGWWQQLPALETQSLAEPLGYPGAVAVQLAFIGLLALLLRRWRSQQPPSAAPTTKGWRLILSGPWPLITGALLLVLFNFSTLLAAGHPWSITWGFSLWGAKAAQLLGWDPVGSPFWSGGFQQAALQADILDDVTSVMNSGVLLGALLAAGLGGKFAPSFRIPPRSLAAAVIGGLLLGYGARIAYGCNIGAFFSGIASLSLHGWLWITCALLGSALSVRWRPFFGLSNR